MIDLRKLPKIEHHRHLDGSLRFNTIAELARKNNLDLGVQTQAELYQKVVVTRPFKTLQEVLDCFWTSQKVLCNYDAIKRVAYENVEDCYREGIVLAELRFAPVFIMRGKPRLKFDEVFEAIIDGVHAAMQDYSIQVGLIHILARNLDPSLDRPSTEACLSYARSRHPGADRLVGFDLADPEPEDSFERYAPLVKLAQDQGLGITIHSGEDTTPEHMWRTLQTYNPDRIGHGIQARHDPKLMGELAERNVMLEVCPTSNWLTGQTPSTAQHPFPQLMKAGVPLSLNSDDPNLMGISLLREYEIARDEWKLTSADLWRINRQALIKSFLPKEIQHYLERKHFAI